MPSGPEHATGTGPLKRDMFGFRLDGKCHQLGRMLLRGGGCDMKQVREAAWIDLLLLFQTVGWSPKGWPRRPRTAA